MGAKRAAVAGIQFGNTDRIRKWTPGDGLQPLASGFTELGCFYVEASGGLIVADRGIGFTGFLPTVSAR